MNCKAYQALDAYRKSFWARLVYYGQIVKEYGPIEKTGLVVMTVKDENDGDCTFDIEADGERLHCEVTPCAEASVREAARALIAGDRVTVRGIKRWDPPHILGGFTGHWEIHPVESITKEA